MTEVIRIIGLITAPVAIGMAIASTQKYANPASRYFGVAGSVVLDVTLMYYRVRLITHHLPLNAGDVGFFIGNVLLILGTGVFLHSERKG